MNTKRFDNYDRVELERMGAAFCKDQGELYLELPQPSNEQCTEFVLDWWAATARKNALVDGRPMRPKADWRGAEFHARERRMTCCGEFMLDLVHTNYPSYYSTRFYTDEYWEKAFEETELGVLLALESEWGKFDNRPAARALVLEDAAKLAAVRARTKVLVFATKGDHERMLASLKTLRERADGIDSVWLWVDVLWDATPPHCGIL